MTTSYERLKRLLSLKIEGLVVIGGSILLGDYLNRNHPLTFSWYWITLSVAVAVFSMSLVRIMRGYFSK